MVDLIFNSATTHSLLFLTPIIVAFLLRAARVPGWAVVGGVLAGILLGPSILGRMLPQKYEQLFVGGIEEREELEALVSRQGADLIVAQKSGFDQAGLWELRKRHAAELEPLKNALEAVRWTHQRPLRSYSTLLIVLTLLCGSWLAVGRENRQRGMITPFSIGLWSVLLPGGLIYAAMVYWWKFDPAPSLLAAAALVIGPAMISPDDQEAADQAEFGGARMIQTAGRFASVLALIAVYFALWRLKGMEGALWGLSLAALVVGWVIPKIDTDEKAVRKRVRFLIDMILIPPLAAAASMKIEIFSHLAIWPIILIALLCGDGRWLGALFGALTLGGRKGLRTMRLVLGSMSCGVTQLAIIAIAVHTDTLPPEIVAALVFGAVFIEVGTPLRARMAGQILEMEEELE